MLGTDSNIFRKTLCRPKNWHLQSMVRQELLFPTSGVSCRRNFNWTAAPSRLSPLMDGIQAALGVHTESSSSRARGPTGRARPLLLRPGGKSIQGRVTHKPTSLQTEGHVLQTTSFHEFPVAAITKYHKMAGLKQ